MQRRSRKAVRSSKAKVTVANPKISDQGKVRLGSFSPSFTDPKIQDKGKVRLGSFSPSF